MECFKNKRERADEEGLRPCRRLSRGAWRPQWGAPHSSRILKDADPGKATLGTWVTETLHAPPDAGCRSLFERDCDLDHFPRAQTSLCRPLFPHAGSLDLHPAPVSI